VQPLAQGIEDAVLHACELSGDLVRYVQNLLHSASVRTS
jgi:hypothetical protein